MKLLFNKSLVSPNGVTVTHHAIARIEFSFDLESLHAHIKSWPTEASRLDGGEPVWMALVVVPVDGVALGDGVLPGVLQAVLSHPDYVGGTPVADVSETLEGAVSRKRAEIKVWRDGYEFSDVQVGLAVFDADAAAQRRIAWAATSILMDRVAWLTACIRELSAAEGCPSLPDEPFLDDDWRTADNRVVNLSEVEILDLAKAVVGQVSPAHATGRLLQAELDAASTIEGVQAVAMPESAS